MFDQQMTTHGNTANPPVPSAQVPDTEIDPVDMTVLFSFEELQEDNESDLVVELIELYLQDASAKIDAIRDAVAQVDGESLKIAAHSLKGSSGTLGVRQLASVCEELERLGNNELTLHATTMVHLLEKEFVRVQEAMSSELHRRSYKVSTTTR